MRLVIGETEFNLGCLLRNLSQSPHPLVLLFPLSPFLLSLLFLNLASSFRARSVMII